MRKKWKYFKVVQSIYMFITHIYSNLTQHSYNQISSLYGLYFPHRPTFLCSSGFLPRLFGSMIPLLLLLFREMEQKWKKTEGKTSQHYSIAYKASPLHDAPMWTQMQAHGQVFSTGRVISSWSPWLQGDKKQWKAGKQPHWQRSTVTVWQCSSNGCHLSTAMVLSTAPSFM